MSDQPKSVSGFILVTLRDGSQNDRPLYLNARHISAVWARADGELSCVAIGVDENPWHVRETVEEIVELICEASGGAK